MNDKNIEKMLKDASRGLVPDISDKIKAIARDNEIEAAPPVKAKKAKRFGKLAVALSLALVLIFGCGFIAAGSVGYAEVYFEVNPGVELKLNAFSSVIDVVMNADAQELFDKSEFVGKSAEDALDVYIDRLADNGYFDGENELEIYSTGGSGTSADKLLEKLNQRANGKFKEKNINCAINCKKLGKEEVSAAKESGVTPGQYAVIEEIISLSDGGYTFDDLKTLPMKELKAIWRSLKKSK